MDDEVTVVTELEAHRLPRQLFDEYYHQFCFRGARLRHTDLGRRPLTEQQNKIYNMARIGWEPAQIANRLSIPVASVYDGLHKIEFNGWKI